MPGVNRRDETAGCVMSALRPTDGYLSARFQYSREASLANGSSANPNSAVQINFILAFNAFLFGLLYGIQQIVREFPIFRRERMVSLGIVPYVLSKMAVLVPILVIAEILMVAILRIFGRLPSSGFGVYGQILLTLWLTAFAALALSLLMSALVSTVAQSSEILPLPIMPQVYFSGAILAIPSMGVVGRVLSNLMISRWSFEALGRVTDLDTLFANNTSPEGGPIGRALQLQYQESFSRNPVQNWLILLVFIVVPLLLTCLVLKRKTAVK